MKKVDSRTGNPALVWGKLLAPPHRLRGNLAMQLVTSFIDSIDGNHIAEGVRLPSSRTLAETLHVGRNTVIAAIDELVEQGYLVSKDRSGVFVARGKRNQERLLHDDRAAHAVNWVERLSLPCATNCAGNPSLEEVPVAYDFKYGQFDMSTFPTAHWRQCERSALDLAEIAEWGRDMFDRDDESLVESLRKHVLPNEGMWAHPDEILVTLGGQEGRYLVAQLLCKAGVSAGMEHPGMPDMNDIISATPARRVYLPIDEEGVCLSPELKQCDVAFMTPGHQCPTTAVMSQERRLAILDAARRRDMILVEDTYQTEYVDRGIAAPTMKALDSDGRVIYIGSLSKSIAPGLRVGFVVAPKVVIRELREIRRLMHRHPPGNIQRALAMFIDRGYYESYLRKVSQEMTRRSQILQQAIEKWLPEATAAHCQGAATFWVKVPGLADARLFCDELRMHGVLVDSGNRFFYKTPSASYLLLAVSRIQAQHIEAGIELISSVRSKWAGLQKNNILGCQRGVSSMEPTLFEMQDVKFKSR